MAMEITAVFFVLLNFIMYLIFGVLLSGKERNTPLTVVMGFFVYYSLFTLFAVPMCYRWRPLSMLSAWWMSAVLIVTVVSVIFARGYLRELILQSIKAICNAKLFMTGAVLLILTEILIVHFSYQFTLDAAYYVANVSTSVQTNTMNIYDPYTGDWQDHFEMRYFFATYPLQDAVVCAITKIPALLQTKTIMAAVVIILTNILYYMIGKELMGEDKKLRTLLMMFFAGIANFFFATIYTTSAFLLTRTYEGKSILGNVILPAILYLYIRIYKGYMEGKSIRRYFVYMFIVCFGATVISNSSNMLVPASLLILFVPFIIKQLASRNCRAAVKTFAGMIFCMLPGIILSLVYIAYVKGVFVFYTYPR